MMDREKTEKKSAWLILLTVTLTRKSTLGFSFCWNIIQSIQTIKSDVTIQWIKINDQNTALNCPSLIDSKIDGTKFKNDSLTIFWPLIRHVKRFTKQNPKKEQRWVQEVSGKIKNDDIEKSLKERRVSVYGTFWATSSSNMKNIKKKNSMLLFWGLLL